MSDLARLLPDGFAQQYWDVFGELPPEEFLEAYEILCEVFYNGGAPPEPGEEGKRGKRFHTGYWFKGSELFGFKRGVDRRVASIRQALRIWTTESARPRARRPRPEGARGVHLAAARGDGDRDPRS